ncbi:hypothetical protein JCM5353_002992 [Sporobolomyces roseus]
MLKFWKSPKLSPNPSTASSSTSPRELAPSVNLDSTSASSRPARTTQDVTNAQVGLGLSMPGLEGWAGQGERGKDERLVNQSGGLAVPSNTERGKVKTGRRSSASQVAFVDERGKGETLKTGVRTAPLAGEEDRGRSWIGHRESHEHSATHQLQEGTRATSPMSFSPSTASTFRNPYGGPSMSALSERDPNQIYAPTTWSDMAHQELVVNLSARERTRQEILWEVVASEERYVAELRSLVEYYANPLLHPLLLTSPTISSPPLSSKLSSPAFTVESTAAASSSSSELPIAARFLRSSPSSTSTASFDHLPEMHPNESHRRNSASPNLSRNGPHSEASTRPPRQSTNSPSTVTGRLASFAFGRSRQSAPAKSKPSKPSKQPPPPLPPIPEALRTVLESIVEMLKGHDELSGRLKEQWAKAFPLVRGLAAIWSDQPWFLQTYATYVVSIEEALAIIGPHLSSQTQSAQSHNPFKSSVAKSQDKLDRRFTQYLQQLEREAGEAGESSLSICLSKPLMRLSKLPLLMQALLYHTDPTTHEWEKTRAMALEVDALVRSIEDEKIEEDLRERTRDALARIDGINDWGLMAPRSSRILVSESPAPVTTSATFSSRKSSMKRSSRKGSNGSSGVLTKPGKSGNEWLMEFTDVVIRASKVGETNVPGSFSRDKEKQGKQGKTRKSGPLRNTYRFIRIERWESQEKAEANLNEMNEAKGNASEASDEEGTVNYAESRMSFRYDSDEIQPTSPRDFTSTRTTKKLTSSSPRLVTSPTMTNAKFGSRLRYGSEEAIGLRSTTPANRHRFDSPTLSSTLKSQHTSTQPQQRPVPKSTNFSEGIDKTLPLPPSSLPPSTSAEKNLIVGSHGKEESSYNLYKMWSSTEE